MQTLPDGEYRTRPNNSPDGCIRRIVVRNNVVSLVTPSKLSIAFEFEHTWSVKEWFTANTLIQS